MKKISTHMFAWCTLKVTFKHDGRNSKMFSERLNNLSQEIRTSSNSIRQLEDNTDVLEESLTINQV